MAAVLLSVVALTGCAAPGEPAGGRPPASEVKNSPAPSTPSVTEEADSQSQSSATIDVEKPASWLITFDGIGPLTIGGRISEQKTSMTAFTEDPVDYCPRAVFTPISGGMPYLWAILDGDFDTVNAVVLQGGADAESEGSPKTAAGIGLGATTAELLESYPEIGGPVAVNNSVIYALDDGSSRWIDFSATSEDGYVMAITVMDAPQPPSEYCG